MGAIGLEAVERVICISEKSGLQSAFDAIREMALAAQDVYSRVWVGALPDADSLCMALSAGGEENVDLNLTGDLSLDIVVNDKHAEQGKALDALADIHHALTREKNLPIGDGWQVLSIKTSSAPTYIEFDGDQWLYGSGLEVHVYIE